MKHAQAQRIYQEAILLAREYGAVQYDDEDGRWVCIERFPLPSGWDRGITELLLVLPDGYPHLPPDGFYVDRYLRTRRGHRIDHYFEERGHLNPYADRGWGWYCIHLKPGTWRPTSNVVYGDNLAKLAAMIRAILSRAAAD